MSIFNLLSFKEDVHVKNIMNTVSSQTAGILYIFYSADTEKLWNLYRNFYISLLIKFNTFFFLGGGGYIKFKIENTCTYLTEVFVIRIHIKFMMVRGGEGDVFITLLIVLIYVDCKLILYLYIFMHYACFILLQNNLNLIYNNLS